MRCNQTNWPKAVAAFTLIEVVVGTALVALVVGALYSGIVFGVQRTAFIREDIRATQIMLEKLEQLRLYRWDQINDVYDPDDPEDPLEPFDPEDPHVPEDELEPFVVPTNFVAAFTLGQTGTNDLQYYGTFNIAELPLTGGEAYTNKMLRVTVGVTWTNRSQVRTREVQTIFSKYGLQNNVTR